jgi:hypothetical protein
VGSHGSEDNSVGGNGLQDDLVGSFDVWRKTSPLPLILAGLSAYLACIPDVIPATANATIYMPVKNTTSELDQRDHHTGD